GLAKKIEEFVNSGKIKKHQEVLKSIPSGLVEIMSIPGMGPKKAAKLNKELKIDSVEKLEKAAKDGEIRNLEGFGEKSEQDIIKNIEVFKRGLERMFLGEALVLAKDILGRLKALREVEAAEIAGSIRRRKETIGDIDILVISKNPGKVMDFFVKMHNVDFVQSKGDTKSSVTLKEGLDCDLRVLDERSFGAALNYFTGSKEHNVRLRQIAITKGWKLSEYGLFDKSGKQISGKTEEEIYKKLGMGYIEPELRENQGEIEAAQKRTLPKLVPYNSIKGDLHMHTNWSDGESTIEGMVKACSGLGYQYISITDHSKSERIANGLDEKRVLKYIEEIERAGKKFPEIQILAGSEVSILKDGKLDFPKQTLEKLDWVVGSIHSGFKMPEKEMTSRVLKALDSGHINLLGHPTGRIVNRREPFQVDLEKVFEKAKEKNVLMEINSNRRLDLSDHNIRKAAEFGLKFCIDTDAHSINQIKLMELGVSQARRGWLEEKDVVNSWNWEKFKKLLK
ncbi:MAG TPA: DNA polymerase/3'-5' exonuclease PolX, partial [archaeon]|nr:DNA polymerase/3'-5' exonuclease PolX [archaeon]